MPVFVFIVFLVAAIVWLLLAFAFIPIGRFVSRLSRDAKDAMSKEDQEEKTTKENKEE